MSWFRHKHSLLMEEEVLVQKNFPHLWLCNFYWKMTGQVWTAWTSSQFFFFLFRSYTVYRCSISILHSNLTVPFWRMSLGLKPKLESSVTQIHRKSHCSAESSEFHHYNAFSPKYILIITKSYNFWSPIEIIVSLRVLLMMKSYSPFKLK